MRQFGLCLALGFAILLGIGIPGVQAQEGVEVGKPENRTLGGYRFVPSNLIPDPFITTHFQQATGVGVAYGDEIPILVFDEDTLLALSSNVANILMEIEYQHAANRDVAFRFRFSGASRLGTGGEAILTQGITAITGLNAGTTIALWNNGRTMINGSVDLFHGSSFRIDVAGFVDDLLEYGPEVAALTTKDDGGVISAGVRFAHAFNEWSGLHGLLTGAYKNNVRAEDGGVILALAGTMDFGQKGGTPIGLMAGGSLDNIRVSGDGVKSTLIVGGGVFYTGRTDFSLGLELAYSRVPIEDPELTLNGIVANLTARFYF
jgi:hypothetical protein